MNIKRHLSAAAVVAVGSLTVAITAHAQAAKPASHAVTSVHVSGDAKLKAEAKVKEADAIAIARKEVPTGKIESGEIEREGGKLIYSFDMKVPGKSGIEEVNVDAMTGALIAHEHETPKAEKKEAAADAKAAEGEEAMIERTVRTRTAHRRRNRRAARRVDRRSRRRAADQRRLPRHAAHSRSAAKAAGTTSPSTRRALDCSSRAPIGSWSSIRRAAKCSARSPA